MTTSLHITKVAGGLVSAVTGTLDLFQGSWAAAYLVLVGGIGQLALGWVPGVLGRPTDGGSAWAVLFAWNLGNAAVLAGTFTGRTIGVDVGSVLLEIGRASCREGGEVSVVGGLVDE